MFFHTLARRLKTLSTRQTKILSTHRLERPADCQECGAGCLIEFNWDDAQSTKHLEFRLSAFQLLGPLRYGMLYECRACGAHWYLFGTPPVMHHVAPDKLTLIWRWNQQPVLLTEEQLSIITAIKATPPHIYGGGSQYIQTPCSITTNDGQSFDLAILSFQKHAPYEKRRKCYLTSDIREIRPSPFALPYEVRVATSCAKEISNGFAPTLVELSNGEIIALDWVEHFLVRPNCDANRTVVFPESGNARGKLSARMMGPPPEIVYFIADHPPA